MGEPPPPAKPSIAPDSRCGWPGSVEDPRPSGCFAKRSGGRSIELFGAPDCRDLRLALEPHVHRDVSVAGRNQFEG